MSFEEVKKGSFSPHVKSKQRITMTNNNGRNVRVSLSADVVDAHLRGTTKVKLMLGTGRDVGLIRLVAADDGYALTRRGNNCVAGVYPKQLGLPNHKFKTQEVTFIGGLGFVEIELPTIKEVK